MSITDKTWESAWTITKILTACNRATGVAKALEITEILLKLEKGQSTKINVDPEKGESFTFYVTRK